MKNYPSAILVLCFAFATFAFSGFAATEVVQELGQMPLSAAQTLLSADQLNNLVAPIALYPDPLLSQILVACTYPLEVVEANQWYQRNSDLKGQALIDAAKQEAWDPSVQALVAVPDALARLNQDIRWTTDLGNAFLAQQTDVMNAVQRMRARAQSGGRLASTPQQIVTTESQGTGQVVKIMPAEPDVIYVPVYDPLYVWGPPVYGYYPPLFYPTFGFGFGLGCHLGYFFSDWDGWGGWGWGPNWISSVIVINTRFFHHHGFYERPGGDSRGGKIWAHNPEHRLNIPYKNIDVEKRFGGRDSSVPHANVAEYRSSGRSVNPEPRNTAPRSQPNQNPTRDRYQPPTQSQSSSWQYRETPQVQRLQTQPQRNYSPQYRETPQVQQYRAPQVQQQYRAPQVQQQYRAPQVQQQYRAPQVQQQYRAPQVQQYRSQPSYQAPSQPHSAPHEGNSSNRRR